MVCKHCGKELKLLGDLAEEEKANLHYIIAKNRTVDTALDKSIVNLKEMTPEQVYAYYKSAYDIKAEASFLEIENLKLISKRLNIEDISKVMIFDDKVYLHPED